MLTRGCAGSLDRPRLGAERAAGAATLLGEGCTDERGATDGADLAGTLVTVGAGRPSDRLPTTLWPERGSAPSAAAPATSSTTSTTPTLLLFKVWRNMVPALAILFCTLTVPEPFQIRLYSPAS